MAMAKYGYVGIIGEVDPTAGTYHFEVCQGIFLGYSTYREQGETGIILFVPGSGTFLEKKDLSS